MSATIATDTQTRLGLKAFASLQNYGEAEILQPLEIPPIVDPLGKYWKQPERKNILLDTEYAVMCQVTFEELHEYSCSDPSGVYPGKMWRADNSAYYVDKVVNGLHRHWLRWFGNAVNPRMVTNHSRKILIVAK